MLSGDATKNRHEFFVCAPQMCLPSPLVRGTGSVCLLLFAGLSKRNSLPDSFLRSCFMYASLTAFVEFGCGTGEASRLAPAADVRAKALIWDESAARLLKLVM